MTTDYQKIFELLTSEDKFYINPGLERIKAVLDLFDNPQEKIKCIHVAGTNGKGSVCAVTSEILKQSGLKTGLYTSPHLYKYTERIKINGENISDDEFCGLITSVVHTAKLADIKLTEFEILTAAAFIYFADRKADIAILETGLGGRFDATNVISSNIAAVITSLSLDHKDRLGNTVQQISTEKAGIIKQNSNVIISADNAGFDLIKTYTKKLNGTLYVARNHAEIIFRNNTGYAIINGQKYVFPLLGIFQGENLALVFKLIESLNAQGYKITQNALDAGLKNVKWPARMQYIKEKNLVIDGAHNPDAAEKLAASLDLYFPDTPRRWFYGCLKTKDCEKIVNILFKPGDTVFLCHFDNKLALSAEDIIQKHKFPDKIKFIICDKTANILNLFSENSINIVTGSFYMIGQFDFTN